MNKDDPKILHPHRLRRNVPLLVGVFFTSCLAVFGSQTNWVSDDWYGSRVSLESVTSPVYSHYAPGAMAVWRVFAALKMERHYWAIFLIFNILIIWVALMKFLDLYSVKTAWGVVLFPALGSSFGIYSIVYAAKGESSLPGVSFCLLGTYFLHKYLRERTEGISGFFAVTFFVISLFFWETNLLFPAFAVVSYFLLNKVSRTVFYRLVMVATAYGFGLATFLALYFSAGAGSLEKKLGLVDSAQNAVLMVYKVALPSMVGWPFVPRRGPNLSPFAFAPQSQLLIFFTLLVLTAFVIMCGRRFFHFKEIVCLASFVFLTWVYFLPISRNRFGLFGEAIFTDFRYLSDLLGPVLIVVTTIIIQISVRRQEKDLAPMRFRAWRYMFLGIVLTGCFANGIVSLYIYGTSSSAQVKTFLENADESVAQLKHCQSCVLLDAPLPDFFGTVGIPWNTVSNIMYVRGNRKPGFWLGETAFMYLSDGRVSEFAFDRYRLSDDRPRSECSGGVTIERNPVDGSNLWTARLVVESSRLQLMKVQFNNDIKEILLSAGSTTIWHQSYSGVDTAIIGASYPACIRSLTTGLP
jgi:hypothetical protein